MSQKWVYKFTEGNANMRNLLGGKGANLAMRYHMLQALEDVQRR